MPGPGGRVTRRVALAYPGGRDASAATFAQPVATRFVELWGLPGGIAARPDAAAPG